MEKALEQKACDCLRVVFFGPESTGKTTLAKTMAERYNTEWVPEYMREYLQLKWDEQEEKCSFDDLVPIAEGQMKLENEKAETANSYLFCDTNLLELKVYSQYYYDGSCPEALSKYAEVHDYFHYFLTYIDVPWENDVLRDQPDERERMFYIFEGELKKRNIPYTILKGNLGERIDQIERFLNTQP